MPMIELNAKEFGTMEAIKSEYYHDSYLGQRKSEKLEIDYDENLLLVKEFSDEHDYLKKGGLLHGK